MSQQKNASRLDVDDRAEEIRQALVSKFRQWLSEYDSGGMDALDAFANSSIRQFALILNCMELFSKVSRGLTEQIKDLNERISKIEGRGA